jgi:hypothetical protein
LARSFDLRASVAAWTRAGSRPAVLTSPAVLLAAATLLGLLLRLHDIVRESLWLDEAGRVAIAALPLGEIPPAVGVVELSPPLYHFVLHFWMLAFGDGDLAVRLLSVLLVVPTALLAWSVGKFVGGVRVGLVTTVMAAVSPFAVHYGRDAAMYALLLVLSLATIRAAMSALITAEDSDKAPEALRRERARGLGFYVLCATLGLYTHYYAGLLIVSVATVGIGRSLQQRSRHGLVLWVAAHAVILLAFVPWLPTLGRQLSLAASVPDWSGIELHTAAMAWAATAIADGSPGWMIPGAIVLVPAIVAGVLRLRWRSPSVVLLIVLAVGPMLTAAVTSVVMHSFRERGLIVAVPAVWVLLAAAIAGPPKWGRVDGVVRLAVAAVVTAGAVSGLSFHYGEQKENWRAAARLVAESAQPTDPIFFVHFGSQLPFDRYFAGPQPRVGLPESFTWSDGYAARFQVTPDDAVRRVPPALSGATQAWVVLSHADGRGANYLLDALDRWGDRASDTQLYGVRVVKFQAKPGSG